MSDTEAPTSSQTGAAAGSDVGSGGATSAPPVPSVGLPAAPIFASRPSDLRRVTFATRNQIRQLQAELNSQASLLPPGTPERAEIQLRADRLLNVEPNLNVMEEDEKEYIRSSLQSISFTTPTSSGSNNRRDVEAGNVGLLSAHELYGTSPSRVEESSQQPAAVGGSPPSGTATVANTVVAETRNNNSRSSQPTEVKSEIPVEDSFSRAVNILADSLRTVVGEKENKINPKDIRVEAKINLTLKSNDNYEKFLSWQMAILEELMKFKGLKSIYEDEPVESFRKFRSLYSSIPFRTIEADYVQAHRNISVWLGQQMDPSLYKNFRIELDADESQAAFTQSFTLANRDSSFRHNAHSFFLLLKKRMIPSNTWISSDILEEKASLPAKFSSFKNPLDYILKYEQLVERQRQLIPNSPKYDESFLANECASTIRDADIRMQIANRANMEMAPLTFKSLKELVIQVHNAKKLSKPAPTTQSAPTGNQQKKPGNQNTDQNKGKGKEPANKTGEKSDGRVKGYCFNFNSPEGCNVSDCKYRHEKFPIEGNNNGEKKPKKSITLFTVEESEIPISNSEPALASAPSLPSEISSLDFILDSGSSGNYTGRKDILHDLKKINPIRITTVAGEKTVRLAGNVDLTDDIEITNVRYIEGSPYSLLSLSKFTDQGYPVVFTKEAAYVLGKKFSDNVKKFVDHKILIEFHRKGKLWARQPHDIPSEERNLIFHPQKIPSGPAVPAATSPAVPSVPAVVPSAGSSTPATSSSSAPQRPILKIPKKKPSNGAKASSKVSFIDEYSDNEEENESSNAVFDHSIDDETFNNAMDLHIRLNHQSEKSLKRANLAFNCNFSPEEINSVKNDCESCLVGKTIRNPIGSRIISHERLALNPMDCWHADLMGPINGLSDDNKIITPSLKGNQYCLTMVDEKSNYRFIIPMVKKSDTANIIIEVVKSFQVKTGLPLKRFRSDGGGEFVNDVLMNFFRENGTEMVVSSPNTPELNGLSERMNLTITAPGRTSLIHSGSPGNLWDFAFVYQSYIQNRLPEKNNQIPLCIIDPTWQQDKMIETFHPFACDVIFLVNPDKITKTSPRGRRGIYLGYSEFYNSNLILCEKRDGTFEWKSSRDVKFLSTFNNVAEWRDRIIDQAEGRVPAEAREYEVESIFSDRKVGRKLQYLVKWKGYKNPTWENEENLQNSPLIVESYWNSNLPLRPRKRSEPSLEAIMVEEAANTVLHQPDYDYVIPNSYREAQSHPDKLKWNEATQEEINSLIKNKTFIEVRRPKNEKINTVTSRFVYAVKRNSTGEIIRWKARWVARGFSQKEGIDYFETFSPTSRWKSLKILLQLAAQNNWEIKQFDFETAFLNAELKEKIYMKPPEGYSPKMKGDNVLLLLLKSLYGLKQASREWWLIVDKILRHLGYISSPHDECIYYREINGMRIYIIVYVDDLLSIYPIEIESEWLADKMEISSMFKIKDLGDSEWILNMSIIRNRNKNEIILSQAPYVRQILSRFNFLNEKSRITPYFQDDITVCPESMIAVELNPDEMKLYQSIIGSLLYAANFTRVDISFITNCLARFMHQAFNYHLDAAYHVLRYLVGTIDKAMIFKSSNLDSNEIVVYSDSDYASQKDNRISVSGVLSIINGSIIHWMSKKQKTVGLSSSESELYALGDTVRESIYLRNWFKFYLDQEIVVKVLCDNQSTMKMADHGTNHDRTKHIDVRHFFLRDNLKNGEIVLEYVETAKNLADLLTKSIKGPRFRSLVSQLLIDYKSKEE